MQTIRKIGVLKATGSLFINGVSNQYEAASPKLLREILSAKDVIKFEAYMEQLNHKVKQYWPCCFAYWCGFACASCTLGLSFLLPRLCVSES